MRIYLLLDRYFPHPLSSAQMFSDLASELSRLGNEVTIVAGDDALAQERDISKERNATVVRVRTGKIRHPSKVIRALNEARLGSLIWRSAGDYFRTHPCELIVAYSPTIFWSDLIDRLKALQGAHSYLVLRDLFPQWAMDARVLPRHGPACWYFRWQELKLYRSADVIGVQSPANLEYFFNSGLRRRYDVEVLFNWMAIDEAPVAAAGLRARLDWQEKVIFVFGGNLGVAQDVDNILRLASSLKSESRIAFLLIGAGSEYERIEREIHSGGMLNVKLLPAVPPEEFLRILAECDVGLITLRRELKTHNFPGKMLSYMRVRKPMLASINPGNDLQALLQCYGAGFACYNGDDDSLRCLALKLAADAGLRERMGNNAYRLLKEKFAVTAAARQIMSHFGAAARAVAVGPTPRSLAVSDIKPAA